MYCAGRSDHDHAGDLPGLSAVRSCWRAGAAIASHRIATRSRSVGMFREGELQDLVQQVPDVTVLSCVWEKDNWHCVFERRHQ